MKLQNLRIVPCVALFLVLPVSLAAQGFSKSDVFGGIQYGYFGSVHTHDPFSGVAEGVNNGSLNVNAIGWDATDTFHFNKSIGAAADFSGGYGRPSNQGGVEGILQTVQYHIQIYNLAFGPVYSFGKQGGLQPFVHALIGGGYTTGSACSSGVPCTSLSEGNHNGISEGGVVAYLGGGVDKKFGKSLSFRAGGDWFHSYAEYGGNGNVRLTAGVVYRF